MAEEQPYSYVDIRRYFENQMTTDEMHAFEKAMMDDPFLSEAIEGFQGANKPQAEIHIEEIRQHVTGKEERTRVIPIQRSRKRWWQAAAILVAIAGTGTITYSVLSEKEPNQITAMVSPTQPADTIKAVEPPPVNFPLADKEALTRSAPVTQQKKRSTPYLQNAGEMRLDSFARPADQALASNAPERGMAAPALMMRQKDAPALNEFKAKVIDTAGQPIPYANVQADGQLTTITDRAGNFSIVTPDTAVRVNISSAGYEVAKKELRVAEKSLITMSRSTAPLSEVVVGYAARKKSPITGADSLFSKRNNSAEPEGGWESFEKYVYKKLNKTPDTTYNSFVGDVEVEFTVDSRGHPENIRLVSPADAETTSRAIQLLKNGPRWRKVPKDGKARIRLKVK